MGEGGEGCRPGGLTTRLYTPPRDLVTSVFGGKTDIVHSFDFVSADSSVNISSLPLRCPEVPVS